MDKNAIKKYAVWARRELIERVSQRAMIYGITVKDAGDPNAESVNGHLLSQAEKRQRQALIRNIKTKGYDLVCEEVAYTWFNRFAALRFMEVNGYLPSHIRVFTNDAGEFKPQILAEAIHLELDGLDMNKVYELESANKSEELFKYLLIVQCNALNSILPGMFQRIEDYTELLLPDYLLREGSVIDRLISDIPEENFDVRSEDGSGQIEIIGWLYQYYISEKHETVVDPLHGKVIKKDEIPAATQLFTTDWVVRYIVDNSVGRYWIEHHEGSLLAEKLSYYVKDIKSAVHTTDEAFRPQDLSTFDPCVGSGHFLVYAFDVLVKVYVEYGYSEREAAAEIVKHNLYGLDIDGRATQLAYFAVMMKARQYDRRFFSRGIQPNVYEIIESNNIDRVSIDYFTGSDQALKKDIGRILDALIDSKEYGSILQINGADFRRIHERFAQIENDISLFSEYLLKEFWNLIRVAEVIAGKYAVVVTNPPYLNKMAPELKAMINQSYKDYSGDMFSVFICRNLMFCKNDGYAGFMTPNVWMFNKAYEKLRKFVLEQHTISSFVQIAKGAFYKEATVDVCSFVIKSGHSEIPATYFRLEKYKGNMDTQRMAFEEVNRDLSSEHRFVVPATVFSGMPGTPIVYWLSEKFVKIFSDAKDVRSVYPTCTGMRTGDDIRFLRFWYEVEYSKIAFSQPSAEACQESKKKWVPYNKGGEFRKWYGNNYLVVNWEEDGAEIKQRTREMYPQLGENLNWKITNEKYYFKPGITWSTISSGLASFRQYGNGMIFSTKGSSIIVNPDDEGNYLLALLNSKISEEVLGVLSPTISFDIAYVGSIPYVPYVPELHGQISQLSHDNVVIAKEDWDSSEISWDFEEHPFMTTARWAARNGKAITIKQAFLDWKGVTEGWFRTLKENEEELNRFFIDIYGLGEELTPEVDDKNVTIRTADLQKEVRSFISYAVGCMFGRYTLGKLGLIYAGGEWDASAYAQFQPDKDGIIPICDDEYFEDDIVGRFVKFVEVAFGRETLEVNLRFIADALGGKGSSRDIIRTYFINDFYADHLKVYQKRPIYWLFDSGKKNGFKCLINMHRYQPDTIARIRTDYVHEQQSRYRTAIADLEQRINGASSSERVKLSKQLATLQAQAEETRVYEEKIHHLADQMIKIDLDDGVKHNYEIFKDVLAKIK